MELAEVESRLGIVLPDSHRQGMLMHVAGAKGAVWTLVDCAADALQAMATYSTFQNDKIANIPPKKLQ